MSLQGISRSQADTPRAAFVARRTDGAGEIPDILSRPWHLAFLHEDAPTGSSVCCGVSSINLSRCSLSGICSFHLLQAEGSGSGKSARMFVLPCGTDLRPPECSLSSPRQRFWGQKGLGGIDSFLFCLCRAG